MPVFSSDELRRIADLVVGPARTDSPSENGGDGVRADRGLFQGFRSEFGSLTAPTVRVRAPGRSGDEPERGRCIMPSEADERFSTIEVFERVGGRLRRRGEAASE